MANEAERWALKCIEEASELYYKLVLIIGISGTGKTTLIQRLAKRYETKPINVNLCLSEKLLDLSRKQRQLKLSVAFDQLIDNSSPLVFLDNIEILFDADLKQDPLRLLQGFSRNLTVVATWNGHFKGGQLIYADPSHIEYKSYELKDSLIISMNSENEVSHTIENIGL